MLLKKLMAAAVMTVGMVGVSQAALVEGTDYVVLPEAIPQLQQDKIEVLEFFGYFCIKVTTTKTLLFSKIQHVQTKIAYRPKMGQYRRRKFRGNPHRPCLVRTKSNNQRHHFNHDASRIS